MDLEEYRKDFLDKLRNDASIMGTDAGSMFLLRGIELLEKNEEINDDPYPISIEMRGSRGRILAFDAFSYDEADSSLILISSEFSNIEDCAPMLTNTRIGELCNHMRNFIEEAVNGHIQDFCDDSDPAIDIAKEFKRKIGKNMLETEITRFKLYILTDLNLSQKVKSLTQGDFLDRPVELNVWTIERFYQSFTSNSSEIIEVKTSDFECKDGIPFIKANIGTTKKKYSAYLGVLPGQFLAKLYYKYGSKLLQGNIRAFLSLKGKVNKGIRQTILNEPDDFFIFNNGVAIVARSIELSQDKSRIVKFIDPQIINGGQTTASLANAIIKKEAKEGQLESIFVPMKLTVLNVEGDLSEEQLDEYNELTKRISKCANSQNAVSEADFFSNHPYHVTLEKLSRQVLAPAVDGQPFQTMWFYERSRGKWEQEQMKLKDAEKKKFKDKSPKDQVVTKEKLAKCLNAFKCNPHQVCQSKAANFSKFGSVIEDLYDNHRNDINDEYFKRSICKVIIFDKLDILINNASWYPKGGDKAQIIPYTIAKLMTLIPSNMDLNWKLIWQKQNLYTELSKELLRLANYTMIFLKKQADGGLVRTIARKEETWKKFKSEKYVLPLSFLNTLWSKEESTSEQTSAKREQKFKSDIDMGMEVYKKGKLYWLSVYDSLDKQHLLSYGECDFIKSIALYMDKGKIPTPAQCRRLNDIIFKAEEKGFIMP